jgi:hypothetical protein
VIKQIIIFTLLNTACAVKTTAQVHGVIADMETHKPIRGAKIYTNRNQSFSTNYTGHYSLPENFTSATVTHPSYLRRMVKKAEIGDTIFLLPYTLKEVVVYGKKRDTSSGLDLNFSSDILEDPLTKPRKPSNKDLLGWMKAFNGRHHPSKKEREKNEKIWKEY